MGENMAPLTRSSGENKRLLMRRILQRSFQIPPSCNRPPRPILPFTISLSTSYTAYSSPAMKPILTNLEPLPLTYVKRGGFAHSDCLFFGVGLCLDITHFPPPKFKCTVRSAHVDHGLTEMMLGFNVPATPRWRSTSGPSLGGTSSS